MHIAKIGDRVRVRCLRVQQSPKGAVRPAKELEFIVGSRSILRGLSQGVVGMAQGDHKRLELPPQEAYGPVQQRLIREIPRGRFPPEMALQVGKRLTARLRSTGRRHTVRVVQINRSAVIVDGNHPLAGKVLTFEIRVISVDSSANANQSNPQFDVGGES